ncbi:DUF2378 family protein [Hyalangium versicolor]|uniref:DUF2378 family protein n=1 Tax=Hyalangium versicolor TaxID=2861190 RepID=UPI001CC9DC0E|nr:DUF2378 family protein [Hyalangium versicolor]
MPLEQPLRKEPVAFDQLMEGLLIHAMKDRLDGDARRKLMAMGVDVDRPLLSAYPLMTLLGTLKLCAEVRFPDLPRDEARYQLGIKALEGFGATSMGKALFGMARMWGARRMLNHMTRVLQTGVNHAKARSRELPGGDMEVTVEVMPEYHAAIGPVPGLDGQFVRGIIAQLVEVCGTRVPVILVTPTDPSGHSFTYRVPLSQAPAGTTGPVVLARVR